jgi:hypothetical protein
MSATKGTEAPEPANPPTTTFEDATEQGYLGQPPDPEPNESYTLAGVGADAGDSGGGDEVATKTTTSKSTSSKSSS